MRLMPTALSVLALATVATPAAAQFSAGAQSRDVDAVRQLNDPVVQEGLAAAVSALAGIVLDTRVGPLAGYADGVRPGDTLRDVKRRDDPRFEARLHDDARRAIAGAGAMAGTGVAMSAEVRRTADRLQAALAPLAGMLGRYDD
jgi:hypothetical protein